MLWIWIRCLFVKPITEAELQHGLSHKASKQQRQATRNYLHGVLTAREAGWVYRKAA